MDKFGLVVSRDRLRAVTLLPKFLSPRLQVHLTCRDSRLHIHLLMLPPSSERHSNLLASYACCQRQFSMLGALRLTIRAQHHMTLRHHLSASRSINRIRSGPSTLFLVDGSKHRSLLHDKQCRSRTIACRSAATRNRACSFRTRNPTTTSANVISPCSKLLSCPTSEDGQRDLLG